MKVKYNDKQLIKLVEDLYWDFDKLSTSGRATLEKIAQLTGVPTTLVQFKEDCDCITYLAHSLQQELAKETYYD